MANATIVLLAACDGGAGVHCSVRTTIGGNNFDFSYHVDELRDTITPEERREVIRNFIRFHCFNMTGAETKQELQPPGISVVTS